MENQKKVFVLSLFIKILIFWGTSYTVLHFSHVVLLHKDFYLKEGFCLELVLDNFIQVMPDL